MVCIERGGGVIITTILGNNKKGYVDISDDILDSKDSQNMSYLKIYCNDLELLKCDSFKYDISNFCYRLHIKIQDEDNKKLTENQVLQYLKESEFYSEVKELLVHETTIVRSCAPHIYDGWKYYKEFLE